MYVQGAWLEGRAQATQLEWLRLALAATLASLTYLSSIPPALPAVLAIHALASGLVMLAAQRWPAARGMHGAAG
jgi:hypothetical protein